MNVHTERPIDFEMTGPRRAEADHQLLMVYRMSRSAGWMAFFTLVIAAGIAACAYLFWQQLSVMQDQLDQMQDLSSKIDKSLQASTTQSAAASQAIQALTEQIRRTADASNQLVATSEKGHGRPWVGIESIAMAPLRANQNATIKVIVRNSGRSPAVNARMTLKAVVASAKSLAIPDTDECQDCFQTVLLPNAAGSLDLTVDGSALPPEKIASIRAGDDTILLTGRIDYSDSSENRHTTTACLLYMPALSTFSACPRGNRLD